MSEYSHGRERRCVRIGFPFCRGETRIEEPLERVGSACGVGWMTLESGVLRFESAGLSIFWGMGCWMGLLEVEASEAANAARKSASVPKSSSSSML